MTQLPIITICQDKGSDEYWIAATSYGRTAPAGERLFKAKPHPDIKFKHTSLAKAERDAALLQEYINNPPKKSRKREDSEEADVAKAVIKDAVWMT